MVDVTGYRPTHGDRLTARIRANNWHPPGSFGCGCTPSHLCTGHSRIKHTEHEKPETTP